MSLLINFDQAKAAKLDFREWQAVNGLATPYLDAAYARRTGKIRPPVDISKAFKKINESRSRTS